MQAGVGLLVSGVMPIYMIIPRYSHNYAQFCQLLNNNSFTHRKILMLLREATSETYGPRVYLHHINLPILSYFLCFLLCFYFTLHLYHKSTKNIVLSYLSDLTLVSDCVGIDNPLSRWLRGVICFVQVLGTRAQPPTGLIPWFSKTEGNTYATLLHHPFPFGENQRSAQEVARTISGAVTGEVYAKVNIPSTHHKPLSPALHYLPFAAHFPLPHFALAV